MDSCRKFDSVDCMVCVWFLFLLRLHARFSLPPFSRVRFALPSSGLLVHLGCSGSPQGRKHRHSFESTRSSPSMLKPTSSNRSLLGSSNTVSMFSTAVISGNIKLTDEEHESSDDGPIAGKQTRPFRSTKIFWRLIKEDWIVCQKRIFLSIELGIYRWPNFLVHPSCEDRKANFSLHSVVHFSFEWSKSMQMVVMWSDASHCSSLVFDWWNFDMEQI